MIPQALGGTNDKVVTLKATTRAELNEVFEKAQDDQDRLVLIEVCTARKDYPKLLKKIGKAINDANSK